MRGQGSSLVAFVRRFVWALALGGAVIASAPAAAETIDFTELPLNTVVNGAKVKGVTFGYTVNNAASTDARFTNTGPGDTTITRRPNLEAGTQGILTLDFSTPVTGFGFSYIALTSTANANGLTVTLTDAAGGTTSKQLAIERIGNYAGTRFDEPSLVPIVRAVIDPNELAGPRFAVDNVTFTPIPEPAALLPLVGGALLLRRRARTP